MNKQEIKALVNKLFLEEMPKEGDPVKALEDLLSGEHRARVHARIGEILATELCKICGKPLGDAYLENKLTWAGDEYENVHTACFEGLAVKPTK